MLRKSSLYMMLLICVATSPLAFGNAAIEEIRQLSHQNRVEEAFAKAHEMSSRHAGNPDFDFLYGLLARKAGHPEIAVLALERVILRNPRDATSIYERGLALIDTKDLISARKSFERVIEIDTNSTLSSNSLQLLNVIDRTQGERENTNEMWLDSRLDVGFTSNANAGSADSGEFLIQGPEVKDGFVNLAGAFLIERYYTKHAALFLSLLTDNRKNFRSFDWDSNLFGARLGGEFAMSQFEVRAPLDCEVLLQDYQFARLIATFSVDASYNWNQENQDNHTTLSLRAQTKYYVDKENNHFALPVVLSHEYKNPRLGLQANGEIGYARALVYANNPGPFVNSYLDMGASLSWEFVDKHFVLPSIRFKAWEFPLSSTPGAARHDQSVEARLGYEWRFARDWSVLPIFIYTHNTSSESAQSYTNYQAQLGLRVQL